MNIFKELKKYLSEVYTEAKKVSWPSKEMAIKSSFIVIGISLVTAVFLGGVDYAFGEIMKSIVI